MNKNFIVVFIVSMFHLHSVIAEQANPITLSSSSAALTRYQLNKVSQYPWMPHSDFQSTMGASHTFSWSRWSSTHSSHLSMNGGLYTGVHYIMRQLLLTDDRNDVSTHVLDQFKVNSMTFNTLNTTNIDVLRNNSFLKNKLLRIGLTYQFNT